MKTYKVDNISELNSHEEMIAKECDNNISQYKDSEDNKLCGVAIHRESRDDKTFISNIRTYMKYRRCSVASRLIERYIDATNLHSKDIKDVPR